MTTTIYSSNQQPPYGVSYPSLQTNEPSNTPPHLPVESNPITQNGLRQVVTLIKNLKIALDLGNTDLIDLSLIQWRHLSDSEKSVLPSNLMDFLSTINSQPEDIKYSFAVDNNSIMNDFLSQLPRLIASL